MHPSGERAEPQRILLVDDDPAIARLVQGILRANGFEQASQVGSGREALEAVDGMDIVLLDHQLPDTSGLELLDALRARHHPPGIVVITAHGNESLAATALRRGADDYLAKDASFTQLLPQILERVRRTRELRKALLAAEQELVRAERLGAVGELTVTLHHEINNPLMAAFADVELMLTDLDAPAEQRRQSLEEVRGALRRIRDIIRQIGELREVRTKRYVAGVRMVDLEGTSSAPTISRGTALVLVPDEGLARIVSLLLRTAGFRVERAGSHPELLSAAGRLGVTLVLVVGGSDAVGAHPLGGFEPPAERPYRVVALVSGPGEAALAAGADRVVQLPFDPGTFTSEILEVVEAS
ncbi:MAG: response regulator [Gemmatimonadales bacterium]